MAWSRQAQTQGTACAAKQQSKLHDGPRPPTPLVTLGSSQAIDYFSDAFAWSSQTNKAPLPLQMAHGTCHRRLIQGLQ